MLSYGRLLIFFLKIVMKIFIQLLILKKIYLITFTIEIQINTQIYHTSFTKVLKKYFNIL